MPGIMHHFPTNNLRVPSRAVLFWLSFLFLFPGPGRSQVLQVKITAAQLACFRKGFVVTQENDTVYALIDHAKPGGIFLIPLPAEFIQAGPLNTSDLPYIRASGNKVKFFMRNGLVYEPFPGKDEDGVFLTVLVKGPLTLYAQLSNYADHGFLVTMRSAAYKSEKGYFTNFDDEYYDVVSCFIRKEADSTMTAIPAGEKKFRNAFIPLIRDNKTFLKTLEGQTIDYYHLKSLVGQYNATYGR
jgi:hypothetical protein